MSEIIKEDYKHRGAIRGSGKGWCSYICRARNVSGCHSTPSPYMHERFQYSNSPMVLPVKLQAVSLPRLPLRAQSLKFSLHPWGRE